MANSYTQFFPSKFDTWHVNVTLGIKGYITTGLKTHKNILYEIPTIFVESDVRNALLEKYTKLAVPISLYDVPTLAKSIKTIQNPPNRASFTKILYKDCMYYVNPFYIIREDGVPLVTTYKDYIVEDIQNTIYISEIRNYTQLSHDVFNAKDPVSKSLLIAFNKWIKNRYSKDIRIDDIEGVTLLGNRSKKFNNLPELCESDTSYKNFMENMSETLVNNLISEFGLAENAADSGFDFSSHSSNLLVYEDNLL